MNLFKAIAGAVIVAACAVGAAQTYTNPVLRESFADPAALHDGNTLYGYATGAIGNGWFPVSGTTDFVHWSAPVAAMTEKPNWASDKGYWAPTVIRDEHAPGGGARYLMYYTAVATGGGHCIDVASSDKPMGPFAQLKEPNGKPRGPLVCGQGYRNIDPQPFEDTNAASPTKGQWFLFWGSEQGQPVLRKQLATADITRWDKPGDAPAPTLAAKGPMYTYQHLREGVYVIYRPKSVTHADADYYYMFTSGYNCCTKPEVENAYAVSVSRANNLMGPWEDYVGPAGASGSVLHNNAAWGNPGGNSVFTDGAGQDWMIYHARPGQSNTRYLLIDPITYVDGWPRVNPKAAVPDTPSTGPKKAPHPYARAVE